MTVTLRGRVAAVARDDPRTDADLLARFVESGDPPAFAALVTRHGPLVLGVCRRALGATADADDAFQATFLVLIRKADTMPWRATVGPWLYGVAHRISRKARFKRDRRFAVETQVDIVPHPETTMTDRAESDELHRAFDDELAALPDAMRQAVVLCELQGVSRAAAAEQLRITEGTLSSRLARARKVLRDRLATRGIALAIPATAAVSAKLTAATVGLVNGAVGTVPAAVWALTQEALKTMAIYKLKLGAVLVAAVIGLTGFGLSAQGGGDEQPAAKAKADPPAKPMTDAAPVKAGPVATVNGQDIGRAEFGEYLIRKHGAKEIEAFVMRKIIDAEAKKKGVTVTAEEVEANIQKSMEVLSMSRKDFEAVLRRDSGETPQSYRDDVLVSQMTMEKLVAADARVTDADLRIQFDGKFGEKRTVQLILWDKSAKPEQVQAEVAEARKNAEAFDRIAAGQTHKDFAASKGRIGPFGRTDHLEDGESITEAAFALKKAGDVSELIPLAHLDAKMSALVKLVEVVPPEAGKRFEDEKAGLVEAARWRLVLVAMPKRFAEWKEKAKPVYHIKPEEKTTPQLKK